MLPDLPKPKREIADRFERYFELAVRRKLGFVRTIPTTTHFEGGKRWTMERSDGSRESSTTKGFEVGVRVLPGEVRRLGPDDIRQRIDIAAEEMASKRARFFYGKLSSDLDRLGRSVSAGGKPLTPELFFTVLSSLEVEFDEEGEPVNLAIVAAPDMAERIKAVFETIAASPELTERLKGIKREQHDKWRLREASRRLVG